MKRLILVTLAWLAIGVGTFFWCQRMGWLTEAEVVHWLSAAGWRGAVIGIALLMGDVILPVPSSVVMTLHGMAYGALWGTVYSTVGSLGAGWIGYGLGRWLGEKGIARVGGESGVRSPAERFFERFGPYAIILSRPVPLFAEIVTCLAGLNGVTAGRFGAAVLAGTLPLSAVYAAWGAWGASARGLLPTLVMAVGLPVFGWGLVKHAPKLANSLRKRRREWEIFWIGRGLLNPAKVNTVRTVSPLREPEVVRTAMPYDEKYYDPRYGDMKRPRDDRRVIYDVYEYYLVVEALAEYLGRKPATLKVLDIGCNNGYVVSLLRQTGFEAYGIDASRYALDLASPFVKPYLFPGGFDDIPFADDAFDVAVSWGTIEHLPEDRSDACLKEAIRVSRLAIWIGCDNVPQSIEPYHLTNYPIDWWERKLERLGQRVDPRLREAIRRRPFLRKRRFYWDALECVLNKGVSGR